MALAAARGAWGWYQQQLTQRPLRTQIVTSGLLWASGDVLAQQVDMTMARRTAQNRILSQASSQRPDDFIPLPSDQNTREQTQEGPSEPVLLQQERPRPEGRLDLRRILTTSMFGTCFVGPLGHFWYGGLEHFVRFRLLLRPNSAPFIAAKVLSDTAIFGPIHLVAFFAWTGLAAGTPWERVRRDICRDFVPAFLTEGTVWPVVQIANFRFVPVQHQLLFVNAVCLLDSAWLSWLKYQNDAPWKQWFTQVVTRKHS